MGITQQRGLEAETAILNRLVQLGYEILVPWNRSLSYDLAILVPEDGLCFGLDLFKDREFVRIQCKMAWLSKDETRLLFNTCSVAEWGRKRHGYQGVAELFAVYSPHTKKIYIIPVDGAPNSSMNLRLQKTKNNQEQGVKWAKDYEI